VFRYILRYYIDPGYEDDARIAELLDICSRGKIEEVMFFYNPEELFQGYLGKKEEDAWFKTAGKLKRILDENEISMSINPWTTLVHLSRGRKFGEEQKNFQPLVGETGVISEITACPFDTAWQQQLCTLFARFASELSPVAIWIEDDWRLHNHEDSMGFGGCFCSLHLGRFEEKCGIQVSREELLKNILAPGKPHPWRKMWLEVSRDSLIEPAIKLYNAVQSANPDVRLGLMSSTPDIHGIEGRDWNLLKEAISPDRPLLLRPHMGPYTEEYALKYPPLITRQTIAEFDGAVEIYPELENSPRCGRYSKSAAFNIYECLHAALSGSHGITINHYDMMGTGLSLDIDFPHDIGAVKPFLNSIAELRLNDWKAEGVKVLFSPDAAANVRAGGRNSMFALENNSLGFGKVFSILGLAYRPVRQITHGGIYAVSEQTLRVFTDSDLKQLCSGNLILDAHSAEIMMERGFAREIGIDNIVWRKLAQEGYAYEEIPEGKAEDYGIDKPRMSAQRCAEKILDMTPRPGTVAKSIICRYNHSRLCPGSLYFENNLGGKIFIIAYPLETAQFEMGYYNNYRRIFMQTVVKEMSTADKFLAGEDVPLHVYRYSKENQTLFAFINPTHDRLKQVRFLATPLPAENAEMLSEDGTWKEILLKIDKNLFIFEKAVQPLAALILRVSG
jgi:hypothetical protein